MGFLYWHTKLINLNGQAPIQANIERLFEAWLEKQPQKIKTLAEKQPLIQNKITLLSTLGVKLPYEIYLAGASHAEHEIRTASATALGQLGWHKTLEMNVQILKTLKKSLQDPNAGTKTAAENAIYALSWIHQKNIELQRLRILHHLRSHSVIEMIGRRGWNKSTDLNAQIFYLLEKRLSEDPQIRERVVTAFYYLGKSPSEIINDGIRLAILDFIKHSDDFIRRDALLLLSKLGPSKDPHINARIYGALIERIPSEIDTEVRLAFTTALGKLGWNPDLTFNLQMFNSLIEYLSHDDVGFVRGAFVKCLGDMGLTTDQQFNKMLYEKIFEILEQDFERHAQQGCAEALGSLGLTNDKALNFKMVALLVDQLHRFNKKEHQNLGDDDSLVALSSIKALIKLTCFDIHLNEGFYEQLLSWINHEKFKRSGNFRLDALETLVDVGFSDSPRINQSIRATLTKGLEDSKIYNIYAKTLKALEARKPIKKSNNSEIISDKTP